MNRRIRITSIALEDIQRAAEDIYIYGYPLLLMDVSRRIHTAASHPGSYSAPLNQFAHARFLPGPFDRRLTHPNVDCLNSSAWLDLNKEPIIFSVPRMRRYFVFSFLSEWFEIIGTISSRNFGSHGGPVGFVGPNWSGKLPAGVKRIAPPTDFVWIDGYCAVSGAEDTQLAHSVQDEFLLTPLSGWDQPLVKHSLPSRLKVDQKTTPQEQVAGLDARRFYTHLARLMQKSPAQSHDSELLAECARIGFFPGEDFAFELLPADTIRAMDAAVAEAHSKIVDAEKRGEAAIKANNWSLHTHPGRYPKNYLPRAAAARASVFPALAEDLARFDTAIDHTGEPLRGANRYVINLPGNLMPPVNAFWSITLYDRSQRLVTNDIQRYAIGDRDRLRLNSDNSLSICIQHEWPGEIRDANWLPAPKDAFNLAFRLYWPKPDVLSGLWRPPVVTRTN
jgi:hypothetical protein